MKLSSWMLGKQSVQFSSVQSFSLCDPMNRSTPGLPVHHQIPEFTQTHAHQVGDAIQPLKQYVMIKAWYILKLNTEKEAQV